MTRNTSKIDIAKTFIVYMTNIGDCEKTAVQCGLDPAVVEELANEFKWVDKIKSISLLAKDGKPGHWEKSCNRSIAFSQAHIFRTLISRVLESLADKDGAELLACMASTKAGTVTLSAKLFSDLASAMEKANHLAFIALGDETANREAGATGKDDDLSIESLHASVISALSSPVAAGAQMKMIETSIEELVRANVPKKPL